MIFLSTHIFLVYWLLIESIRDISLSDQPIGPCEICYANICKSVISDYMLGVKFMWTSFAIVLWRIPRETLMISQQLLKGWLGAVRVQAITRANVDPNMCHHMASFGHESLNTWENLPTLSRQTFKIHSLFSWIYLYIFHSSLFIRVQLTVI